MLDCQHGIPRHSPSERSIPVLKRRGCSSGSWMLTWTRCTQRKASTDTASRNWWPSGSSSSFYTKTKHRPLAEACSSSATQRGLAKAMVKSSACTSAPSSEVGATPNKCSTPGRTGHRQRIFQGATGNRDFPAGSHRPLRTERILQNSAVRRLLGRPTQLLLRENLRQLTAFSRIRSVASLRQIPPVHLHQVPVHVRSRVRAQPHHHFSHLRRVSLAM